MVRKQLKTSKYVITIFLFLSLLIIPSIGLASDYTVVKGDSLSKIAKRELGDWRKWRDLAEMNALEVVKRNGYSHVHLFPGQKLKLKEWTVENVVSYYNVTRQVLEKEIFEIAGMKKPSTSIVRVQVDFDPSCQQELRLAQIQLRGKLYALACQERLLMAKEIFDYTEQHSLHFFKDKEWIAHRKTAFLLMSLLEVESDGYFVRGKHGEWGPYQIKVDTFKMIMKYRGDDIANILMTSHLAGMKCALKILKMKKNPRAALAFYNSGKKKWTYASQVLKTFNRILVRASKMDVIGGK